MRVLLIEDSTKATSQLEKGLREHGLAGGSSSQGQDVAALGVYELFVPSHQGFRWRRWITTGACVAVALGIIAYAVIPAARHAAADVLSSGKQQPLPPPPTGTLVNAPGPDNTLQSLPPQLNLPPQPPSPVKSESDPSKKLKGG